MLRERAPHRPLGAHALRGAGRHLGRAAQSRTCRTTCSTTRSGAPLLIEALHHRLGEVEKRRTPGADAARDARRRRAARSSRATAVDAFAAQFRAVWDLRKRTRRACSAASPPRTTSSSTACRASRTSPTRPTGASSIRSSCSRPTPRPRWPALVAGCIELGLTIIPRGGGTGYTGGAMPLTWIERGHQHREARGDERGRAWSRCPGVDGDGRDGVDRSRRRHAARRRRGRARRLRVRGRPDLGRGLVHRRQHRDERRRQEGGAVGHGARQPRLVAHGHARGQVARGHAPGPQPRQDPRRPEVALRAQVLRRRRGKKLERTERLDDPGRASSARKAWARTSPTSSSPACPASRRKAATA